MHMIEPSELYWQVSLLQGDRGYLNLAIKYISMYLIVNGDNNNNEDADCALLKRRYKVVVSKSSLAELTGSWWHPLICMAATVHTGAKLLGMILDIALFPVLLLLSGIPCLLN